MSIRLSLIKNALLTYREGSLVDRLFVAVCPELFTGSSQEVVDHAVKTFFAHPHIVNQAHQGIYRTLQRVYRGEEVQKTKNKALALAIEKLKEHRPNRIVLSAQSLLCSIKPFVWESAAVLATVVVAGFLSRPQGNRVREPQVSCDQLYGGWENLTQGEQQWLQNLSPVERVLTIRNTCFPRASYPCPSSPELFLPGTAPFSHQTQKQQGCHYLLALYKQRAREIQDSCREGEVNPNDCAAASDCVFEAIKGEGCHLWAQPSHYSHICHSGTKRPDCNMKLEEVAQRWELRGSLAL